MAPVGLQTMQCLREEMEGNHKSPVGSGEAEPGATGWFWEVAGEQAPEARKAMLHQVRSQAGSS